MDTHKSLNDKQEMFVNEYLKCFNATKAAKNAGYSEKSAGVIGHELLKKPEIASRVQARMREAAMSADEVLYHLAQIVRGDIDDIIDTHGNLDLEKARAAGKTNLIKKIKSRSITSESNDIFEAETEPYDRMRAMELIGKHLAMFTDNLKVTMTHEDEVIAAIRNREAWATVDAIEAICLGDHSKAADLFRLAGVPIAALVDAGTTDSADIE